MNTIETLYAVGDTVFLANTTTKTCSHDCPDCLGSRKWSATSPAGAKFEVPCPRCTGGYQSNRNLSLSYTASVGTTRQLTIGSVRFDSHDGRATYMCEETGVGGGSVYREKHLFIDVDDAQLAADAMAAKANAETDWIVKQYEGTLSFSDYQFESAILKDAKDAKIKNSVSVQMLFEDLRYCETLAEVQERLDEGFNDQ